MLLEIPRSRIISGLHPSSSNSNLLTAIDFIWVKSLPQTWMVQPCPKMIQSPASNGSKWSLFHSHFLHLPRVSCGSQYLLCTQHQSHGFQAAREIQASDTTCGGASGILSWYRNLHFCWEKNWFPNTWIPQTIAFPIDKDQ